MSTRVPASEVRGMTTCSQVDEYMTAGAATTGLGVELRQGGMRMRAELWLSVFCTAGLLRRM